MKLTIRTSTETTNIEWNDDIANPDIFLEITESDYNDEGEIETDEETANWIVDQIKEQNEAYEKLNKVSDDPISDWNEAINDLNDYDDIPRLVNHFTSDKFRKEITKQIGRNIKESRTDLEMTQKQLAEIIGTTQQQIFKYESGEQDMTLTRLRELEKALHLTAGDLLRYT